VKLIDIFLNKNNITKLAMDISPKNKIIEFFILYLDNSGTESLCLIKVEYMIIIAERKINEIMIKTFRLK
jgi:hypothetical protein